MLVGKLGFRVTFNSNSSNISLMPHMRTRERIFGYLAIFGSFVGGCGLILLSIFDTKRHASLHRVFLLVFMLGVAISALFTVIEVGIVLVLHMTWF